MASKPHEIPYEFLVQSPKKTYEIPVKPLYNPIIKPLNAINARITYVVIVLYNPIVTSLQSHQIPIEPH